jgi:hypothetical protein
MSREYRIWVTAAAASREEAQSIEQAVEEIWPVQEADAAGAIPQAAGSYRVILRGDGALTGGRTLDAIAREIQRNVWAQIQKYVEIHVTGTCLEPDEAAQSTLADFERERDAGMLDTYCCDCGERIPFGSGVLKCAHCRKLDEMEAKHDG